MSPPSAAPRHEFQTAQLEAGYSRPLTVALCLTCRLVVPVGMHTLPPCPGPAPAGLRAVEAA